MDFREQQRVFQEHEEMKRILQAREERFQFQEMKWMRAHEEIKRIFHNFIII
jgi:hypothetical protein